MLRNFKKAVLVFLQKLQSVDDKLIIFEAYQATSYACSPKALYEQILKDSGFTSYRFVWVFRNIEKHQYIKTSRTELVKFRTLKYYLLYTKAKYWVNNGWLPVNIYKKKNQVYLQCWHGTPLKRLRADIVGGYSQAQKLADIHDTLRYDYFISPSRFATEKFTSAFQLKELGKENIIIETGYPRNDILSNYPKDNVEVVRQKLKLPAGKKVILYAPTWRDDQRQGDDYIEKTQDFSYLQKQLEDDYVILFRSHYNITHTVNLDEYKGFIYDVSHIDDVNELYIVSDILVTDYSSVLFDFANLKRPMIFYMYDRDHYQGDLRGFYFDLSELPGDIVQTEEDLVNAIKNINSYTERHIAEYEAFSRKFNYLDDGQATQRVIEKVFYE